jgi:hypothetical protein
MLLGLSTKSELLMTDGSFYGAHLREQKSYLLLVRTMALKVKLRVWGFAHILTAAKIDYHSILGFFEAITLRCIGDGMLVSV